MQNKWLSKITPGYGCVSVTVKIGDKLVIVNDRTLRSGAPHYNTLKYVKSELTYFIMTVQV